ncbi:unnamed protein product [Paramecium primaurelia]|uniref:WD40-repeat-containing domain n=1 Tax=Paramecium primaurelia TaxID=5886 RepID=A0A8S1N2E2_PARPR|nr:unnamed protein product [Paramecium primaurelia]CAD8119864.1 unnamed protein product [Paramecium primaurelia]
MVDLNKVSAIKGRFVCPQCVEEIPKSNRDMIDQFKCLDSFFGQWEVISKENRTLILYNMEQIFNYSKIFQNFNDKILNIIQELTQYSLHDLQKQLNFFEVKPERLSIEQIYEIAENLSNQEYLYTFRKQQEVYYHSYLEEIERILEKNEIKKIYKVRPNLSIVSQQVDIKMKVIPQKKRFQLKWIIGILLSLCIMMINQLKEQDNKKNIIENKKEVNFSYEIIESNIKEQNIKCSVFAFNQQNSIIIAGCEDTIKIFEFDNGNINCLQTLNGHNNNVSALYFMKNSNEFISGDIFGSMFFWKQVQYNKWQMQQQAKEHTHIINQIIMNSQEDLIISCSHDKSIIFWNFEKVWKIKKIINEHKSWVLSLSLNENQNQLISCDNDGTILVMNKQPNNDWKVIQNIRVKPGYKLTFIDINQFVYQPNNDQFMEVYKSNNGEGYKQIKIIDLKYGRTENMWYFPSVFIMKKQILINKYDNYIHIIKKNMAGDLQIEYSIQFKNNLIYGVVSNDGEYLITWDEQNQFKIRKYFPSVAHQQ